MALNDAALARHYPQLTPDERFRLVVEARARGDTTEEDRLIDACPKLSVRMNDPQFVHRWLTAQELVTAFVADTGRFFGWLEVLAVMREAVGELLDGLFDAAREHDAAAHADADDAEAGESCDEGPAGEEEDCTSDDAAMEPDAYPVVAMEVAHNVALGMIRARWEAFGDCCEREMGLPARTVLGALWPAVLERVEALPAEAGAGLRNPERYAEAGAEWREQAREVWRSGTEGD
jgi:hypothetical protein